MKVKIKTIFLTGLFYISLILIIIGLMMIFEPNCVTFSRCMSAEIYYLVFTPAVIIFTLFFTNFIKKRFSN